MSDYELHTVLASGKALLILSPSASAEKRMPDFCRSWYFLYLAALYNNVAERTTLEFAVDYTNQQTSIQLRTLDINNIENNSGELSVMCHV